MVVQRGNAAIRDHVINGEDFHIFKTTEPAHVRYLGQMVCAGTESVSNVPGKDGHARSVIVFRLVPIQKVDIHIASTEVRLNVTQEQSNRCF